MKYSADATVAVMCRALSEQRARAQLGKPCSRNSVRCRPPRQNLFCVKDFGASRNQPNSGSRAVSQPIIVLGSLFCQDRMLNRVS